MATNQKQLSLNTLAIFLVIQLLLSLATLIVGLIGKECGKTPTIGINPNVFMIIEGILSCFICGIFQQFVSQGNPYTCPLQIATRFIQATIIVSIGLNMWGFVIALSNVCWIKFFMTVSLPIQSAFQAIYLYGITFCKDQLFPHDTPDEREPLIARSAPQVSDEKFVSDEENRRRTQVFIRYERFGADQEAVKDAISDYCSQRFYDVQAVDDASDEAPNLVLYWTPSRLPSDMDNEYLSLSRDSPKCKGLLVVTKKRDSDFSQLNKTTYFRGVIVAVDHGNGPRIEDGLDELDDALMRVKVEVETELVG